MTSEELDLILRFARKSDIEIVRETLDQLVVITKLAHGEEIAEKIRSARKDRERQKLEREKYAQDLIERIKIQLRGNAWTAR